MAKIPKKPCGFRLGDETIKQIKELADQWSVSDSDVVGRAVGQAHLDVSRMSGEAVMTAIEQQNALRQVRYEPTDPVIVVDSDAPLDTMLITHRGKPVGRITVDPTRKPLLRPSEKSKR